MSGDDKFCMDELSGGKLFEEGAPGPPGFGGDAPGLNVELSGRVKFIWMLENVISKLTKI